MRLNKKTHVLSSEFEKELENTSNDKKFLWITIKYMYFYLL
jgi:hypothetical protein